MLRRLRDHGLTIALLAIFAGTLVGQILTGWASDSHERALHGTAALGLMAYLGSGHFLSALFENWESEFLQMWALVILTAVLYQRGSPESKDPDGNNPEDRDPAADRFKPGVPGPVRRGGFLLRLYSHSLGLALLALFLVSFVLHAQHSTRLAAEEARSHGAAGPTLWEHVGSAQFWFESFQNWQSEFLSAATLVVLAIFLRERGSAESKPVATPHGETS